MKIFRFIALILIALLLITGCNVGVNRTIRISDGETTNGATTVNGSIYIGNNCTVNGKCTTVNGKIKVGYNSEVKTLTTVNQGISIGKDTTVDGKITTVNGAIKCAEGVRVDGNVSTVNGPITCGPDTKIDGTLGNVNGNIHIENTTIAEDIKTNTGDITIENKSTVEGDIIIRRSRSISKRLRKIDIEISGNSVVNGDIIVKDDDLEVKVYLSNGGKVNGEIKGAEVIQR